MGETIHCGIASVSLALCSTARGYLPMPGPVSNKGHKFEPLSYAVIGACIDIQRRLGLHCMEVDYRPHLEPRGLPVSC